MKVLRMMWLVVILTACTTDESHQKVRQWMQPTDKVKVLSTIAMIDDIVAQVGGEHVETLILIKGDLDPHSYQLVKGDDEKLLNAQLIFYNGLGLEHGPSLQHHLHNSTKSIAVGDEVIAQDPTLLLKVNGQRDPHIWMDIALWSRTVPVIVEALSKQDPEHAQEYHERGEKVILSMRQAHEKVKEKLHAIPAKHRFLVTSHDAFYYFTRAYLAEPEEKGMEEWGMRFVAPEGLAPESQLSTTQIQEIINHLTQYQIKVLFPESNVSKDSIRKIVNAAKEKGLDVCIAQEFLYADAMGRKGSDGDTYLRMIQHNVDTIEHYLNSNYQCP